MVKAFVNVRHIMPVLLLLLMTCCLTGCAQNGGGQEMSAEIPKTNNSVNSTHTESTRTESTHAADEHPKQFVGVWQDASTKGAGWSNAYQFFADGKFKFNASQMDCAKREVSRAGRWRVGGRELILQVEERTVIKGGELVDAIGSCASDKELINGTPETEKVTTSANTSLPLNAIQEDAENHRLTLRMGDAQFWKYDDDPTRYP